MLGSTGLSRSFLEWLENYAPQGILITDESLVVRGWNRWLEANTGMVAGQVIGRSIFEVFPELVERNFAKFYTQVLHGESVLLSQRFHHYLLKMPAPAGVDLEDMQQTARISPLHSGDKIVGTVTILYDVSERVVHENELHVARLEAEKANQTKDDFLATVSHELRGPLTSILGWVAVLQTRSLDQSAFKRALESIERNAKAQNKLLGDLLDIARVTAGKLKLEKSSVSVATIAAAAVENLRPVADAKKIELRYRAGTGIKQIHGDSLRIQQILVNLLSNAIKFTPAPGKVSLEIEQAGDSVRMHISDTGVGIDAELLPHIFERFRQGKGINEGEGLGLGLAIVRELVELHGGTIRAESAGPGTGAAFTVTLPAGDTLLQQPPAENTAGVDTDRLRGIRILLVEDNDDSRETLENLLVTLGAVVRSAASADQAFTLLKDFAPHVILSDLSMPGESGFAFIQRMRRSENGTKRRVPAIAVSAFTNIETQHTAFDSGFDAHVAKPVNLVELAEEILRLKPPADAVEAGGG
jgi:signal transduction histidine kinase/ActR/RegA family two-component response regulator